MDEKMKPPGEPVTFDTDAVTPLSPEDQREHTLGIIRRAMAAEHVEAWGPEQVLAFAENFRGEPLRMNLGGMEPWLDAETLREAARMEPDELRRRYEAAAASWRQYTADGALPGQPVGGKPPRPLWAKLTEEQERVLALRVDGGPMATLLPAEHDAVQNLVRFGYIERRDDIGYAATDLGREWLRRRRAGTDTDCRETAAAAPPARSGARVRVREAQLEAVMPFVGLLVEDGRHRRVAEHALDAIEDATLAAALGKGTPIPDAVSSIVRETFPDGAVWEGDRVAARVLSELWERGALNAEGDDWPAVHYLRSSMQEIRETLTEAQAHHEGDGCPDCAKALAEAITFADRTLSDTALNGVVPLVKPEGGPDLVSRMIDARDCLRGVRGARIAGALRWLEEGIEEGLMQRAMLADLRVLVAGEPHVCSCGSEGSCTDGRPAFEDRCRFERALRTLLGVEPVA